MTIPSENPQAAAVAQGVYQAYMTDGYVNGVGVKDNARVKEQIFEVLRPHKVRNWAERENEAITRGEVTQQVFPSLPGPDKFSDQDDPQLAAAIWTKVDSAIWSFLQANAAGPVQRLVGINLGDGYVMCRTQVGLNSTDAVYITDDRACIERDYLARDNDGLQAKIRAVTDNREMLIMRQPGNAAVYAKGFSQLVRALGTASNDRLALAVSAATADGSEAEAGNGDEPGDQG
jgi:hypothetical protein